MQLFYNQKLTLESQTITFSQEESKHIVRVLRKKQGDSLMITNGLGFAFKATIQVSNIKNCIAKIDDIQKSEPKPYKLHVGIAPTKMMDRFEWFLEKATEIGIDEITPIICDHSERKFIKHERCKRIVLNAMKQSLQHYLPILNPATTFQDFISKPNTAQKIIAHCENSEKNHIKHIVSPSEHVLILIGPEGDFSKTEIINAKNNGYIPITLGKNRLRTETAAMVVVHSICYINQ